MIVALAGGVGGAKLARGLAQLEADRLTVIVNTGDDFDHLGLRICPDLDTVTYTLCGMANPLTGWGVNNETWNFMNQTKLLGGQDWFMLGDRDLALHVLRTEWLNQGRTLTEVTVHVAKRMGVRAAILPMSDSPVRTRVQTNEGWLDFQDYFVRRRCDIPITGLRFDGAESARPTQAVVSALDAATAFIICPSNPYVSIDPILSVAGMRRRLELARAPRVAVSPIIGRKAVKGPAAKMMAELGHSPSSLTVARKYSGLIDGLMIDRADTEEASQIEAMGIAVEILNTLMLTPDDSVAVSEAAIAFAKKLSSRQD